MKKGGQNFSIFELFSLLLDLSLWHFQTIHSDANDPFWLNFRIFHFHAYQLILWTRLKSSCSTGSTRFAITIVFGKSEIRSIWIIRGSLAKNKVWNLFRMYQHNPKSYSCNSIQFFLCGFSISLLYKLSTHIVSGLADHCINQLIQPYSDRRIEFLFFPLSIENRTEFSLKLFLSKQLLQADEVQSKFKSGSSR